MNTDLMFSSKTDLWSTPQDLFDELNEEFHFQCDVCAISENAKCDYYFTPENDGLKMAWSGRCWCNPPYGKEIGKWIKKAVNEINRGVPLVVMLIPARTDTKWFHDYIYNNSNAEVRFLKGRLKFGDSKNSAPFPSMVVVFRKKKETMVNAHEFIEHLLKQQEKPSDLLEIINRGCAIYEMRKFIGEIEEGAQND